MIRFFTGHPTAANLLMLILIAMGAIAAPTLRRETFPEFDARQIEVRVAYPGATAEEVDQTICRRIIDAVDGVEWVEEVRSDAREGVGSVTIELAAGGNFQTFRSDIEQEVSAIDDFPDDAEDPVITQLGTTDIVLAVIVSGPLPPPELREFCEAVKGRIQSLEDVSLVDLEGFSDQQLRVELDPVTLRGLGLSVSDVAGILERQSIDSPAGTIDSEDGEFVVRFTEERRSARELERLVVVSRPGGAEITLGDLGRVVEGFEREEDKIEVGGVRAGLLRVKKTGSEDTIRVADAVKALLREERSRFPSMRFDVTQDISVLVKGRLDLLLTNGWQGMLLVFLAMWLFFAFRLSFWVAAGLPVSFLGAMYFMPHLDLTINMMTMVGLLLALGLLMDDAIVVTENIATHRVQGKSGMRAAVDGVTEVLPGVLASFLTTVCVLGPLALISGDIGKVLRVVPIILILVLMVSLVEALCILPAHLGHSMRSYDPSRAGRARARVDAAIEWTKERLVGRPVDALLRWRYLTVGCVVGVFLLSMGMVAGGLLKFQAFPSLDGDVVEARVLMAQGTPLERTESTVERIAGALGRVNERFAPQPGGEPLVARSYVRFDQNADAFENGAHVATITVDLLSAEKRSVRVDDVLAAWREEVGEIPDAIALTFLEPTLGPSGRAIEIVFRGGDLGTLKQAATTTRNWLARFDGTSNLSDDLRPGKTEYRVEARAGALGLDLDAATMARQLRAAYHGQTAAHVQVDGETLKIDVVASAEGRDSVADLDGFAFTLADGQQAPLDAVATVSEERGWARIARVDGERSVTLRGDVDERIANTSEIFATLKRELLPRLRAAHPGLRVDFEGETAEGGQTQRSMMMSLGAGLIGVFVILSFQFRSYIEPLVVMVAIPFSLIGVVWGHILMGVQLSLPSMLGFISLAGVVVNDSILLVEFLKQKRDGGESIEAAAGAASRLRFRAVMLTSLTTIAGLLPLLAERSLQAQVLIPIAISIVFGLAASTVLVLLVIPCLYSVLYDLGLTSKRGAEGHDSVSSSGE
ncbi:MAG: efflux RND transporter permease subunit [Phycisphaeraceae bacterium]|nr:efflux RND transporter permease subunit [Phycisphaeraceae bacterium]